MSVIEYDHDKSAKASLCQQRLLSHLASKHRLPLFALRGDECSTSTLLQLEFVWGVKNNECISRYNMADIFVEAVEFILLSLAQIS